MWQRFGRAFYTRQGARGTRQIGAPEDAFPGLMREATGVMMSRTMQGWVTGTADLPLARLLKPFGVSLSMQAEDASPSLGIRTQSRGGMLTVTHALSGGAGQRAGLAAGDQVLACDGLKVDEAALKRMLARKRPGDVVQLHVFRRDVLMSLTATLERPPLAHARLSLTGRPNALQRGWLGAHEGAGGERAR
jgi:predicted metalloprotease with PDZ domain